MPALYTVLLDPLITQPLQLKLKLPYIQIQV